MQQHALVVLGCRIRPSGQLSAACARRVGEAAAAFQQGVAPLIVVSGGRTWNGMAEAVAMSDALQALGVPAKAIIPERASLSTRDNARYSAVLLRARGLQRVAVVTCDWHLPRAVAAFERAGLEVQGMPARCPHPAPSWRRTWRRLSEHLKGCLDSLAASGRPRQ